MFRAAHLDMLLDYPLQTENLPTESRFIEATEADIPTEKAPSRSRTEVIKPSKILFGILLRNTGTQNQCPKAFCFGEEEK